MIYERMRVSSTPSRGGALPTYQRKGELHAPGSGVSARIDDSAARIAGAGGDAEARALAGLGNAVKGAVDVGVKAYDDYQNTKATEAYNLFQKAMNEKMYGENGIFIRQGEAAFDSTENMESALRDTAEEVSRQLKLNEYAREKLNRNIYQFSTRFMPKAMEYASEQRMKWADEQDRASLDLNFEGLLNNADDRHMRIMYLSTMQKTYNQYAERNGFSPAKKELGWKRVLSGAYSSLADKFITNGNLNAARELVNEDALWLEGDQDRIRAKIKAEGERLEAKAEANRNKQARTLLSGLKDAEYAAQNMGDDSRMRAIAEGLQKIGMKNEAEEVLTQADFWQANRHAADYAQRQPLPDVRRKAEELQSQLKSETDTDIHRRLSEELKATAKIFSERVKAYQDDPAQAAASSVTLPDDATPEDVARLRMENERANGVPPDALMPLTQIEAGQLATQWAALPAEQRPAFIHGLQVYGAYAPQVMKQVGISVMEQDMAFSMLNDPQNVGGAKAVFSAMSLDEKDLPKIEEKDALAEFLEDSDVYQVYLTQAQATNSPDLWKTVKDYEQAATRLLKTGKSVEDVKRILNAGRERLTGDNMAVLVPAYHAEEVKNGLQRAMGKWLEAFVRTGMSDSPDYEVKEELRRIRNTGIFVNSPDGKGFTLLDGVTGLPYRDNTGNTFSFSMDAAEIFAAGSEDALLRWVANGMAGVSE